MLAQCETEFPSTFQRRNLKRYLYANSFVTSLTRSEYNLMPFATNASSY
jgi:hypothetical protein